MPWGIRTLRLYHGTIGPYAEDIVNNGVDLNKCTLVTDFGRGFYTTRLFSQAIVHANLKYQEQFDAHTRFPGTFVAPGEAVVVEFTIILDAIGGADTLAFVQPTSDWVEFVRYCRLPSPAHKGASRFYDAVYGPVWLSGVGAMPDGEQLSLHTGYATSLLNIQGVTRGSPLL